MVYSKGMLTTTVSLLAGLQAASAHSWVEALYRIGSDGAFVGAAGYPIGYLDRSKPGFSDLAAQNKILDTAANPAVCKPLAGAYQTYDRLSAAPGDYVAMLYQENGHVTDPTQTVRPYRGGNVYVYGTPHHEDSDGINDVLNAWTPGGEGGNGKGRLLASHFYDDLVCYQNRGGSSAATAAFPVYTERHGEYGKDEVACQTAFQLPADLPTSGKYTVMWVWDWPRIIDDKQNVTEIYTSCAEIELRAPGADDATSNIKVASDSGSRDVLSAAIPSQISNLIEATALGVGTASPAPVSSSSMTADPGDATGTPATPTDAPAVSLTTTTAHQSPGNGNGIKTVTVTADPETTTRFHTVTVPAGGNGNNGGNGGQQTTQPRPTTPATVTSVQPFLPSGGNGGNSSSGSASSKPTVPAVSASASASASTSQPTAAPSQTIVTSVEPFLKVRATGAARRSFAGRIY